MNTTGKELISVNPLFSHMRKDDVSIELKEYPDKFCFVMKNSKPVELDITGDLHLMVNGELSFATKDGILSIDTIGSQLHFNSRLSTVLKDLPDSIEYRKKLEEEREVREKEHQEWKEAVDLKHAQDEKEKTELLNRIANLEKAIKEITDARNS